MKHLQKIIPICLLALALVISITLLTPKADAATESDLTFTLNDDGNSYTVSDCNEYASGELVIPATYNGKPVTAIGNYAFGSCFSLQNVTIPDSVTTIGNSAFGECFGLTDITMPDGITSIGDYAFFQCHSLQSITIPNSVISIGQGAFSGCSDLTYNTYDNARYLGNDENPYFVLFKAVSTDITKCVIVENTKFIGTAAFEFCSDLTDVTIPDSVTSIGSYAFSWCSNLTSITIPDSVTSIGRSAFYSCSGLTGITIPDSVTTIGDWAFFDCDRLTGVIIPTGVIQLEENTFRDCENLKSVVMLEGVTDIAYHSFFASGLETIAIPESVASISTAAFEGADDLRDVYYGGSQEQWEQITISYFNESLLGANIHFNHIHNFVDGICAECMISGGSDQPQGVPGDLTGDNQTNNEDVVLLLWHTLFPKDYPLGVSGDINKDGRVNNDDVVLLLWHTLFPEDYPL